MYSPSRSSLPSNRSTELGNGSQTLAGLDSHSCPLPLAGRRKVRLALRIDEVTLVTSTLTFSANIGPLYPMQFTFSAPAKLAVTLSPDSGAFPPVVKAKAPAPPSTAVTVAAMARRRFGAIRTAGGIW